MSSLFSITNSWIWYALCVSALVLFVGSFSVVFRAIKDKRKTLPVIISILNLILIAVINFVFMDCGHACKAMGNLYFSPFQFALYDIPYSFFVLSELLSCIVFLSLGFEGSKYRSSNLTVDAIQQAVDALPEGIAVCGTDGTVRLSNLKINALCRSMTGKVLTDANKFWSIVEQDGKEQGGTYLMRFANEKVWLFEKEKLNIKGGEYVQITATDVTERYAIIDELEKKNEHLLDIRKRMKAVSDLSGDMFIAQEEADAKAALHNQLGQVLLMGRHYINHQDVTDPKIVYAATVQMNQFLLGEAKEPYKGDEDTLAHAVAMANSIGVRIEFNGAEPKREDIRNILSQAITECAANTIKHAEGDLVTVDVKEEESSTFITITNNGKAPKCAITESGGLLSLRRNIEAMDGSMETGFEPGFILKLKF